VDDLYFGIGEKALRDLRLAAAVVPRRAEVGDPMDDQDVLDSSGAAELPEFLHEFGGAEVGHDRQPSSNTNIICGPGLPLSSAFSLRSASTPRRNAAAQVTRIPIEVLSGTPEVEDDQRRVEVDVLTGRPVEHSAQVALA
jgi:hypothetical protein